MDVIAFLKQANTVLLFVLLVSTLLVGGYLVFRSQKPLAVMHVAVDSTHLGKK
jgi:hypothetical protein